MSKELVAVTIPIYKKEPDAIEIVSLVQCLKVLGNYPVVFFAPENLDTSFYKNYCEGKIEFIIERFDNHFFNDIKGYNELMLSPHFYSRFDAYKFILIYQLDAFVFKDELQYWCNKHYDYIGAPYIFVDLDEYPIKILTKYRRLLRTFEGLNIPFYRYKHLGNGGFSLRNVKSTIRLLTICRKSASRWTFLMEDNFFQYWGNILFFLFKLPDELEAAKFSIELNPKETFNLIGEVLPFGCHAFMRYEPEFWLPIIREQGYTINE